MGALKATLTGDILRDSFAFTVEGRNFVVRRYGETTYVFDEEGKKILGTIRPGGSSGGSIWRDGDCVGEYYLVEREYYVVPIEDGFRQPEKKVKVHPVDFLVRALSIR